ncbi:immune inhibitor A domain-containing protein [Cellulomonas fimi]|uniref:immune inhibitor A domain-containing protein n=1 Tax=Cellulomonas fimi TaxID=1708 RepID=UPI002892D5DA|nr:immune inhibitor A domain-containing protein [Cellulomonas fimi]
MRRVLTRALAGSAGLVLVATLAPSGAGAVPDDGSAPPESTSTEARSDNRPGPLGQRQAELRKTAIERLAEGTATADADGVVQVAEGAFVETATTGDDRIFTILAEFGTGYRSRWGRTPGPVHNQIPEPDRSVDNSTYWAPDFSREYYEELLNGDGESMRTYFEDVSNGLYSVTNVVTDWVTVPWNASYYGDNVRENDQQGAGPWDFVADAGTAWWDAQIAAGQTPAQIDAFLSQFDVWDRYDFDNDGNFDEADGYIDRFQAVHAGEGEEAGADPDAIWSHRSYVRGTDFNITGPDVGATPNRSGGAQIGRSRYWIGDYTVEPENGGLGVFVHEYGHDLGLPDLYDYAGGENGTAFWSVMSSGSWLSHGAETNEGIGTTPGLLGPEEKLFLGWLDYSTVDPGQSGSFVLNPSQLQEEGKDQAVRINLPDVFTSTTYTTPASGEAAWWTGRGDQLNELLVRQVPPAGRVTVTADAWYDIEEDFDYLYAEYSLDGVSWERIGQPVTGTSDGEWDRVRFSYVAQDQPSWFRFRYQTDVAVNNPGAFIDNIVMKAGSRVLFTDDVESGANGWTTTGLWQVSNGTVEGFSDRYYLVENREYVGWDDTLRTGPYQFSRPFTMPSWVDFFPYQNGMLVWSVDHSQPDNNVSQHPGTGNALVVDARPESFTYSDGLGRPTNRRQPFDATFGLEPTDAVCLYSERLEGETVVPREACAPSNPGIPVFDDSDPDAYYSQDNPQNSVRLAGAGVRVTVTGDAGDDLTIDVVNPAQ